GWRCRPGRIGGRCAWTALCPACTPPGACENPWHDRHDPDHPMTRAPLWDGLLLDARLATLDGAGYGLVEDAALGWKDGRIVHAGPRDALPPSDGPLATQVLQGGGRLVTPGLVDCHTHLVFGGDRAGECEQRLLGASYEEIARAGGGIVSTVRATRQADAASLLAQSLARARAASARAGGGIESAGRPRRQAEAASLLAQSRPRARALVADGVTTLEIKSGYGLDFDGERRMLQVARQAGASLAIEVRTTFLGAHALPPEYAGRADDYIDAVCQWLPRLHAEGLVDAVDAFCERIGFDAAQTRRVFEAARALGLPVKLHADQL